MCLFLSTLSLRRATGWTPTKCRDIQFLSTLSLRRATTYLSTLLQIFFYFYPRSPCGERQPLRKCHRVDTTFLSTLSLRRATAPSASRERDPAYFYPRSPCGERPHPIGVLITVVEISIHALLAESDAKIMSVFDGLRNFYPRSPCGERRASNQAEQQKQHISIHALLAESDQKRMYQLSPKTISIHALLAESDHFDNYNLHCVDISIHALLAESDGRAKTIATKIGYFYPRSPCGERPPTASRAKTTDIFLSTLSLRRATEYFLTWHFRSEISIHALLAESDANTASRIAAE